MQSPRVVPATTRLLRQELDAVRRENVALRETLVALERENARLRGVDERFGGSE